jgi:hypothetical protein
MEPLTPPRCKSVLFHHFSQMQEIVMYVRTVGDPLIYLIK